MASKNRRRMGYRRIVQLLVYLITIPTVLLLMVGIVMMFLGEYQANLLMGILVVSFVACVVTGVILVIVFVRREANLSELQADFVSKVSHELRTPLTAVRLFADTLDQRRDDPATVAACIDALKAETAKLTDRIERLLDWGRMEAGRKLYDLQPESVREIIESAVEAYTPIRRDDGLTLDVDVPADLPQVLADKGAMIDAIGNLLSNAQKYGGTPPKIRIGAVRLPKNLVAIEVTDNGDGIPLPDQARVFEKFMRLDDRLSREQDGYGLGLAIVTHIARGHGGRVELESGRGRGSTFRIVLQVATAAAIVRSRAALPSDVAVSSGDF